MAAEFGNREVFAEEEAEHKEQWRAAHYKILQTQLSKLSLLAKRYEVDQSSPDWHTALLLRLAQETIPGFKIDWGITRKGAKEKWTFIQHAELIADIEAVKRRIGCKDAEACSIIAKQSRYKSRYGRIGSATKRGKTLQTKLIEARKTRSLANGLPDAGEDDERSVRMMDGLVAMFALDPEQRAAAQGRLDEQFGPSLLKKASRNLAAPDFRDSLPRMSL